MTDTVLQTAIVDLLYPLQNPTENILYQHDTKFCMEFDSSNPRSQINTSPR